MHYKTIKVDTNNKVQTITLNRPDKLNAWTQEMTNEIRANMEIIKDDGSFWQVFDHSTDIDW